MRSDLPGTHESPVPDYWTSRDRHLPMTGESTIRDVLERERVTALARLHELNGEFNGIIADAVDTNADDEHDPEGPTIAYERARVTALLAEAQSHVGDLNEALARLESGDYSICETCSRTIPTERLEALPACRTCIECAVARRLAFLEASGPRGKQVS
jgi:DnaK suppressor protein